MATRVLAQEEVEEVATSYGTCVMHAVFIDPMGCTAQRGNFPNWKESVSIPRMYNITLAPLSTYIHALH